MFKSEAKKMSKFLSSMTHKIPDQFMIYSLFNEDLIAILKTKISKLFSSIHDVEGSDEIPTASYS